ncbi:hypothetical protein [Cohnella sp. REN36]|uniref:hypothetical protein n=1 Tax=Cohnella sp. REN36 TaxID=2887347 RepID=UPI001D14A65F|nr:hypothetical protein [Cohnella sp. REN36]MCC3372887.1 hypothetical protein [Cohnella sp. REN36]
MNTNTFQQLLAETGDLLYRVRMYDRELIHGDEILEMDRTYEMLNNMRWMDNSELLRSIAADKLLRMRRRLLTLMEDLLFSA